MARTQELLKIFSNASYPGNYTTAKASCTCIRCGGLAKAFRDASARLEYAISAFCQMCQDDCFEPQEALQ
ncbi:hypothetical protein ACFL9T_18220 [Thermodesulfobacteriota bacterium]